MPTLSITANQAGKGYESFLRTVDDWFFVYQAQEHKARHCESTLTVTNQTLKS